MSEQEIKLLRDEIMQHYTEIAQYNCVLYTTIAVLLAFGINSNNYLLCLLPYVVLFPIHFMCEARRDGICRIGAYLSVFCRDTFRWEKRLHSLDTIKWRSRIKKHKKNNSSKETFFGKIKACLKRDSMYFQFYLISILSSASAIYKILNYGYSQNGIIIRVLFITLLTIISFIVIRKTIVFVPDLRQSYINEWNIIKEKENSRNVTK